MAKVGEGDPRWIVAERQDGANVNAWHWEERDLSNHTHAQLRTALAGLPLADPDSTAGDGVENLRVVDVSEISGDVTVAQRKGKMMCYFELQGTLNWAGSAGGSEVKGKLTIPAVDHDEFRSEYEITVSCQERTPEAQRAEDAVRRQGRARVRAAIEAYFNKLFDEYHIGQTLKSGASMPPPPPRPEAEGSEAAKGSESKASAPLPFEATSFTWRLRWRAPQEELFVALTDERRASMYTRAPAKVDAKAGGQFEFLGGVISGYYVDVQPPALIKQQWRLRTWPAGVHSSVVIQLVKEEPGVTVLEFAQSGIPAGEMQSVQEGWKANFFEAIRMVFGYSLEYL